MREREKSNGIFGWDMNTCRVERSMQQRRKSGTLSKLANKQMALARGAGRVCAGKLTETHGLNPNQLPFPKHICESTY